MKLYEYFEDEKNVYLITELCQGGELFEKIVEKEFFEESYAARIFKQIQLEDFEAPVQQFYLIPSAGMMACLVGAWLLYQQKI